MAGEMMRAVEAQAWGGPEVLRPVQRERPEPGPTEVLVRVHAAGINPVDWKTRKYGGLLRVPAPFVPGYDVSGVVEAVGMGVVLFRPGDEVYGMVGFPHLRGAYAEYLTAPTRHLVAKPAELSHVTAAALPLAALTAWQALFDVAGLRAGQRVLVHAAAGGLGHLAVQIAKAAGAYVIGTASTAKHEYLRGLGADELIDYRTTDFASAVSDLDVVLDTIGGDYGARSLPLIKDGGALVNFTGPDDLRPGPRGIRSSFMLVEPDRRALLAVDALVREGRLRPTVVDTFPLAEAAKAHEVSESGRTTGKLVLRMVD
ncbi:NADPH:quinone reductase [Kitasatospora sp. MMS16-BH015]|uniref:NADP-dependent oxidoreductase n=1 Tax=Kitasatospora sp. MMS16-BH015 TaxID=2018025 RepID=UPI000CA363A5|nr:NADP-dependent oxidoreductase [Kitasatospora sp. MMS16-BH015]AUG78581.1 NADPH:quinone reductase [Kitasatospora sp. MMS16-BH015]